MHLVSPLFHINFLSFMLNFLEFVSFTCNWVGLKIQFGGPVISKLLEVDDLQNHVPQK